MSKTGDALWKQVVIREGLSVLKHLRQIESDETFVQASEDTVKQPVSHRIS